MHVLHYWPVGCFQPISSGAGLVAANQVEYFRQRGWRVDLVVSRCGESAAEVETFVAHYRWANRVTVLEGPVGYYRFPDLYLAFLRVCRKPTMRAALQSDADLFFANSVYTAPLLDLLPATCPRILETVDVQSHQMALAEVHYPHGAPLPGWASQAKWRYLFRLEMDLLSLYDAALMITPDDMNEALRAGLTNAFHVPPLMPLSDSSAVSGMEETDLLFVGGANPYNQTGIKWFYGNVYLPWLARHGVRLTIAGKVCNMLDFQHKDVQQLGMVTGPLQKLYRSARLVIVPILEGTGISIKTLEGMANCRTVVTTPVGARGLDRTAGAFVCIDMQSDPQAAAATILDLLATPSSRRTYEEAARAYMQQRHGPDAYFASMDRALDQAHVGRDVRLARLSSRRARIPIGACR
jgi:hypothetical protein